MFDNRRCDTTGIDAISLKEPFTLSRRYENAIYRSEDPTGFACRRWSIFSVAAASTSRDRNWNAERKAERDVEDRQCLNGYLDSITSSSFT